MKLRIRSFAAVITSILLAGAVQAGPISSAIRLQADSRAGAGAATVTDTDSQSQGATLNPLSASVLARAVNGNAVVESTASGAASWTDPDSGTVVLSDIGWRTQNVGDGSAFLINGVDFEYVFTADVSGTFTIGYNIGATGSDLFGLQGFIVNFNGDSTFLSLNAATTGTLNRTVVAGTTYTLRIENLANIFGPLGTRDALMTGTFNFSGPAENVDPVPEPASVVLFGLGVAGIAGYGRRRKPAAA